jgi:hypothetical protein
MTKTTLILGCMLGTLHSFSQSDVSGLLGHQRAAGRYVGWDPTILGSVAGSLDVRNDFAGQPINFFTGGSAVSNQRMIINGSTGTTTGFVGIGRGFTAPQSLLYLNNKTFDVFMQVTDASTGAGAANGLKVGLLSQDAYTAQQEAANLFFTTAGLSAGTTRI